MTLERSEAGAGGADRATAGPNINRACWKDEDGREHLFEGIVGRSAALQRVLRYLEVVAPTDSGALILGKTGTGEELIVRAIQPECPTGSTPYQTQLCREVVPETLDFVEPQASFLTDPLPKHLLNDWPIRGNVS